MAEKLTVPRVIGADVELLSIELLEEHARRLAALLSIAPRGHGSGRAHLRRLKITCARCATSTRSSPTTRVKRPCRRRRSGCSTTSTSCRRPRATFTTTCRRRIFKRLPRVAADEFAGLPRIYALALELIGSSAGRLDAQRLQRFISAFQSITPLTIGELWAWPSVLKLALIDHLRQRA